MKHCETKMKFVFLLQPWKKKDLSIWDTIWLSPFCYSLFIVCSPVSSSWAEKNATDLLYSLKQLLCENREAAGKDAVYSHNLYIYIGYAF